MNKLTSLIHNYNINCFKKYTNVSKYLGGYLDDCLKEIEKFYYSQFWELRLVKRLKEENITLSYLELEKILGTTSELRENTKFKLYSDEAYSYGISNLNTMIALNINMNELNDSHINNVIMHEFGHRQYNQSEFKTVVYLNKQVINNPKSFLNQKLSDTNNKYFTDHNELRQRIIPIIKEIYDNNWTADEAYDLSINLKNDDIKNMFNKEYIIHLLNRIL